MDIIPATAPKSLTSDAKFSNYLSLLINNVEYKNFRLCKEFLNKKLFPKSIETKGNFQIGFYGYYSCNSTKTFDKRRKFF